MCFFLLLLFPFASHLEVSHTLQVLDRQGSFHLLDAVHHGTAYQNVGQQETWARGAEPSQERQSNQNQNWRRATEEGTVSHKSSSLDN